MVEDFRLFRKERNGSRLPSYVGFALKGSFVLFFQPNVLSCPVLAPTTALPMSGPNSYIYIYIYKLSATAFIMILHEWQLKKNVDHERAISFSLSVYIYLREAFHAPCFIMWPKRQGDNQLLPCPLHPRVCTNFDGLIQLGV